MSVRISECTRTSKRMHVRFRTFFARMRSLLRCAFFFEAAHFRGDNVLATFSVATLATRAFEFVPDPQCSVNVGRNFKA